MRRVAICIFVMTMTTIALSSFDVAQGQGEIFYLSFEQVAGEIRDPGIPGDGIIISSLPLAGFVVSPPFSLERVTNGITFTAFFRDTQPGIDVTDIRIDLRLTGQPPVPPCGFYNAVRASSPPMLTPPVNGVRGIAVSFTRADLDAVVHPPQPAPECARLTINDYSVQNVLFFKGEGFGVIPDLDAFAVGLGVNVFPTEAPSITSIAPSSGPVGTLVTITGSNFGSAQGSSTVKFGTTAAAISSWSDTQIKVTVPSLSAGTYDVAVTTSVGSSNSVTFEIKQITLCSLDGINDTDFERALPEIKRYLRQAFQIAGVSQNILEAVTWGEFQGTPLWNILIFAITVDDLLRQTDRPLDRINHEQVLLDLTSFTAEWGFTSLLSSLGPSFAGVAAWASLGALPITSSLQSVYRAVNNGQIRRQIELYFLARNAGCSYESIVNSQDDCAGATLFYDNGWLYAVDAGPLGNKTCDYSACVPRPLTPAEVYEYAEWLRSLEEVRSNYLQDKEKIENILRDRIAQCLE